MPYKDPEKNRICKRNYERQNYQMIKEYRIKNKEKHLSKEHRRKIGEFHKNKFKNKEFLNKFFKSTIRKPNKKENILIELFKKNNLPYKYVGDYRFWIDGKNPDFVNINGQKKIIELFGIYWHNLDGKETTEWEDELKNINNVIDKVVRFDKYGSTNNF